jgi:drug/metabolite transporter (DMT)-like permease
MSLTALALVVAAAFIHAYWNLLAKRSDGGPLFVWLYSLATFVLYAPVIALLIVFDPPRYGVQEWLVIAASGVLHLMYALTLQRGYRAADLSVVYPLARGTGPLLSSIGAILLFGERPTIAGIIGIALIVSGIWCIAGGPGLLRTRSAQALKGVGYGMLTGCFIASYTVNDAYAVKFLAVSPILLDYFGNLVRLAFLSPVAIGQSASLLGEWRRNRTTIIAVGALIPLSYILALYAFTIAPVSYVAPARELSMLVGTFFGARLLNEGSLAIRMTGAALILFGIVGLMMAPAA